MIWKLLRKNISVGQIAGYALAVFIGLSIVLCAVRFYADVSAALGDDDADGSLISKDFMVISPPVSTLGTAMGGRARTFTADDVADLQSQPWVLDVGEFNAARFHVNASMDLGGRGISSYLFLESIPDEFIDIKPEGWEFDPADGTAATVPVILNKDYLALYNFGFASTRGLPQLSESTASLAPVYLQFTGNGRRDTFRARIVGFSSRLNTIAVPDNFLRWANDRYASEPQSDPSRLIVKVRNPGDPAIAAYMADHGYEVAGDKADSGKAQYFLTLLTTIVIAIGAIISALALFILMLSIFLLLQKNRGKISDLLMLGYTPSQVAAGYYRLIGGVNALVLVLAVATMLAASALWEGRLAQLEINASSPTGAILWGTGIMLAITAVNFLAIRRSVRRAFYAS